MQQEMQSQALEMHTHLKVSQRCGIDLAEADRLHVWAVVALTKALKLRCLVLLL